MTNYKKGVSLILACAGSGKRAEQGVNKLLVKRGDKTVLEKTFLCFYRLGLIKQYIIVYAEQDEKEIQNIFSKYFNDDGVSFNFVLGGQTRTQSVVNGLNETKREIVLIHDGARPFVSEKNIKDCIEHTSRFDSAITVINSRDAICKGFNDNQIEKYLGKSDLYQVQTPQGFKTELIKKAYAESQGENFNDDGEVFLNYIANPHFILGSVNNVKLTYPEDFEKLNCFDGNKEIRFGVGFDCHKLVENRKLILGGIEISHDKGLLGHSDADVLTHAIMDAILSSVCMRDIGYHFPDTDQQYKNANSMKLLEKVLAIINEKGYKVESVSAVIMAEKPKLMKHIPTITENLAKALSVEYEKVGITATTLEGLGFVGREEGICVNASAVVKRI